MKISEKYREIKDEIDGLIEDLSEMKNRVVRAKREPTAEERQKSSEILDRLDSLEGQRTALEITGSESATKPIRPSVTADGGFTTSEKRGEIRSAGDKIDYRSLFGDRPQSYLEWTDKDTKFFQAVFSGRMHPGLKRDMGIDPSSAGGFLVPTEYARQIHDIALESQIIMPRANVIPMSNMELELPAMTIGDHSSNLYGGFTASYIAEKGTISEASPTTRAMTLKAKKLTGLVKMSNELIADAPNGEQKIMEVCGNGLGWYQDKAFLKGTGSGEPMGVLNSNCLLKQNKETGQSADTIVYENLTKMLSKLNPGSFKNSLWICHQTTIPQLLQLAVPVGTAGSHVRVLSERDGEFAMLTRPCIFTEKTEPLGSQGDILLVDLTQYVVGLRDGLRFDISKHVYFTSDQSVGRLIARHDGQALWDKALTLEDGSNKVSPFVTLKARA